MSKSIIFVLMLTWCWPILACIMAAVDRTNCFPSLNQNGLLLSSKRTFDLSSFKRLFTYSPNHSLPQTVLLVPESNTAEHHVLEEQVKVSYRYSKGWFYEPYRLCYPCFCLALSSPMVNALANVAPCGLSILMWVPSFDWLVSLIVSPTACFRRGYVRPCWLCEVFSKKVNLFVFFHFS